jgi:hypothetical protein
MIPIHKGIVVIVIEVIEEIKVWMMKKLGRF